MADLEIDDVNPRVADENLLSGILKRHPLSQVGEWLGNYLGTGADCVSLTLYLSMAAGRQGLPFNVAICSDDPGAEHLIADRLINIVPEVVKRTETIKQFRELADAEFTDTDVVVVRSLHDQLFRFASESSCRDVATTSPPSVWLISDIRAVVPQIGPTLSLMARQTDRSLSGFGHLFSNVPPGTNAPERHKLRNLLLSLKHRRPFPCPFQDRIRAELKPSEMLIFNRLLATITSLRVELANLNGDFVADAQAAVDLNDYRVARKLLINLPVPGRHCLLSSYAADTGEVLYEAVMEDKTYQLTIPCQSDFGNKAFTRRFAEEVTDQSYNTIKDHLAQLEAEGIVESLTISGENKHAIVRRQGRQIYFRFAKSRSPPFGVRNPFDSLPTWQRIAADCTDGLQSEV